MTNQEINPIDNMRITLCERLLEFARETWGEDIMADAFDDFAEVLGVAIDPDDPDDSEMSLLMNWFQFHHIPPVKEGEHEATMADWKARKTNFYAPSIAQQALKTPGFKLTLEERSYLNAQLNAVYSFYQVMSGKPDGKTEATDLRTGQKVTAYFPGDPSELEGSILFSKVVELGHRPRFVDMGDIVFSSHARDELVKHLSQFEDDRDPGPDGPFDINSSVLNLYGTALTDGSEEDEGNEEETH